MSSSWVNSTHILPLLAVVYGEECDNGMMHTPVEAPGILLSGMLPSMRRWRGVQTRLSCRYCSRVTAVQCFQRVLSVYRGP